MEICSSDPSGEYAVLDRCRELLTKAEEEPLDAPLLAGRGPAAEVERLATSALDAASDSASVGDLWLLRANALRRLGRDRDDEALAAFGEASRHCSEAWRVWFDLGLLHKWRSRWRESLHANEQALKACPSPHRGIHWNIAIAATALGQGERAKHAWAEIGVPTRLAGGGLPVIEGRPPPTHVRLPVRGEGGPIPSHAWSFEVVRVAPLSPCHGVIESPAFREAPCDYGDVILWDGSPAAWLPHSVTRLPVFPLLEILNRGTELRFRFVVWGRTDGAIERLERAVGASGQVFWRRRDLNAEASHAPPGDSSLETSHRFDTGPDDVQRLTHGVLVAPANADLVQLGNVLDRVDGAQVAVPGLYETLGDSRRAGREHQAWRALESKAARAGEPS